VGGSPPIDRLASKSGATRQDAKRQGMPHSVLRDQACLRQALGRGSETSGQCVSARNVRLSTQSGLSVDESELPNRPTCNSVKSQDFFPAGLLNHCGAPLRRARVIRLQRPETTVVFA
jgi:hypothetical protein